MAADVVRAEGMNEACSSCDDRNKKLTRAAKEFAAGRTKIPKTDEKNYSIDEELEDNETSSMSEEGEEECYEEVTEEEDEKAEEIPEENEEPDEGYEGDADEKEGDEYFEGLAIPLRCTRRTCSGWGVGENAKGPTEN